MPNQDRYNLDDLIEIFGTPRPFEKTILRWRRGWRDTNKIYVNNYIAAQRYCADNSINSLFFQMGVDGDNMFVSFYYEEHAVFFRLSQQGS